jgi:hypothetical protein
LKREFGQKLTRSMECSHVYWHRDIMDFVKPGGALQGAYGTSTRLFPISCSVHVRPVEYTLGGGRRRWRESPLVGSPTSFCRLEDCLHNIVQLLYWSVYYVDLRTRIPLERRNESATSSWQTTLDRACGQGCRCALGCNRCTAPAFLCDRQLWDVNR